MNNLEVFLNENKTKRENVFYAASSSFKDSDGNAVKWELRPVTTAEEEDIRASCSVYGDNGSRLDMNRYIAALVARSVVYPNLYDAKLQDSYNVKTPEALIVSMVDSPGEFGRLVKRVQQLNGFTSLDEDIAAAKN